MRISLSALAALALGFNFLLTVADGSSIAVSQATQAQAQDAMVEHTASSRLNLEAADFDSLLPRSLLSHSEALEGYKVVKPRKQKKPTKPNPSDLKKHYFHSRKIKSKKFQRHPKASGSPPPAYRTSTSAPPPAQKPNVGSRKVSRGYRPPSPPPPAAPRGNASSPSPSPAPAPSTGNAYQQAFLDPHNAARAKKSLAPLSWDSVLEDYARQWGNHQRDTDNCNLVHSNGQYGENLFWGYGAPYTAADAVSSWTSEEKYYNYATNSCASGQMCGHYTQVVWKSTTHLGCATINCKDSSIFIICSYNPPGNYIGEKPY